MTQNSEFLLSCITERQIFSIKLFVFCHIYIYNNRVGREKFWESRGREREAFTMGCVSVHHLRHSAMTHQWRVSQSKHIYLFCFLGPLLWHMEVPRLEVPVELQLPAYTTATAVLDLSHVCDLQHSSQQHQILNPLREARDRTRILMGTSQMPYCWATIPGLAQWVKDPA